MGVFNSVKKMPRRVKRTIRKTLSGICMVSALTVALVPAEVSTAYQAPSLSNSYAYGVEATDKTVLKDYDTNLAEIDLAKYGTTGYKDTDSTIYKTMTVKQLSTGAYEIGWQFKLYTLPNGKGVICNYNSMYATGVLEIAAMLPLSYIVVEESYFQNFFDKLQTAKDNNSNTATVSATPENGTTTSVKASYTINKVESIVSSTDDQYWISKYFTEDYTKYEAAYNEWLPKSNAYTNYQTELAAWNLTDKSTPQPTSVDDPGPSPTLTVWVADLQLPVKYQYFCAAHPYYMNKLGGLATAETFALEKVVDARNGSTTPTQYCYMPKGTPKGSIDSINKNDEFGFLGSNWTTILGIGDNAFANTTNVTELKLCEEMKYIGDGAFYNSFVEAISFDNVQDIGNRAFKDCTRLKSINLSNTTVNIGTEAFYGCNSLTSVTLPQSIAYIGPGSFAACTALSSLDLSAINQSNCNIDNFAFYNDIALSSVTFSDKIARIGEAAFACSMGVSGNLLSFKFPDHISTATGIGNFVLAGRTNLQHVTMPSDYGRSTAVELPFGVFYNCINLKSVTFPSDGGGSCGLVTFGTAGTSPDRTIFDTIQSQDFCVYGPEYTGAGQIASPRQSTWGLKTGLGNDVPYIYTNTNGEQVEISNSQYILIIDDNGVLQSCTYASNEMKTNAQANGLDLVIPEMVGATKVTGVSSSCFAAQEIHDYIKTITISDNTITEIAANAFKDCTLLEKVKIGNSVTKIGDSAFEGCYNLDVVEFTTPKDGYSSFPLSNIGNNAFETKGDSLIFIGDINVDYGPFQWAMQSDNYVDETKGIRVCYKTGYPYYQTVIVDNRNGYPTLVDYLHYDQVNAYDTSLGLWDPSDTTPLTTRYENLGKEILNAGGGVDYTYSISLAEEKLINAALNLQVPSGVKSVDVNGYMNNTSKLGDGYSSLATNSYNVSTYLTGSPYYVTYKNNSLAYTGGLFKGFYGTVTGTDGKREFAVGDSKEQEDIGNDRLQTVTFNTVKYLPDYCFYSCENLYSVNLGSEMEDVGVAPFTGCNSLSGMGSTSDKYISYNGIVYSENDDGTYTIVEVLSSRGNLVGSQKVRVSDEDPYMSNVSQISPGAFEDCDYLTGVDFTGTLVKEIPDNCFKNCDKLNQVTLPDSVESIGHNAFAGCMEGITVVAYGREVYLPSDAFGTKSTTDGNDFVESKRVVSYEDSAVRKAASDIGADVTETLDDTVKVQFFDYDGKELSRIIYVVIGNSVSLTDIPDDPVREGYTFTGWNKALTNITTDQVIVATYKQNPSNTDDNGGNSGNNGGTNGSGGTTDNGGSNGNSGTSGTTQTLYTLTVTNGNGSGSYAAGAVVIITCTNPPSGKEFDKWVAGSDDLGIASVNVSATTLVMPAHEAKVEATFKDKPSSSNTSGGSGSGSSSSGGSSSGGSGNSGSSTTNGNQVVISKPGISNVDLANISVSGSSDNYVLRIAETAAATQAIEKALTAEYGSLENIRYSAMDITLYDSTGQNRITDYSGLSITVTIPIPSTMTQYGGNNKVAGVVNEQLDKLNPKFVTIDGVPCISFTATHFSPYVIYTDVSNMVVGVNDETPKTGDGIHPKWFLVAGLSALGIALFFMKDKKKINGLETA